MDFMKMHPLGATAPLVLAFLLLMGCASDSSQAQGGKVKVIASFYPLYDFAKNVGGDRVEVSAIIPAGIEPHEFEPSPGDIRALGNADVFVYNGAGMEPWAERLVESSGNKKLIVVDTSAGLDLLASGAPGGGYDPHFWLDPVLAKKQVDAILKSLIAADPAGKETYESNAENYKIKLDALDAEIRSGMSACGKKDVLITHATLAYFCKEYGCSQVAITGINPEAEPSASELAAIIDQARERNVTAVFFESLMDPRSAQTISQEIGGHALIFNSVHGLTPDENARGENYITLMGENLANLQKGLACR